MTRYHALRSIGCGPIGSAVVSAVNWIFGVPEGLIKFLMLEIEYPVQEPPATKETS